MYETVAQICSPFIGLGSPLPCRPYAGDIVLGHQMLLMVVFFRSEVQDKGITLVTYTADRVRTSFRIVVVDTVGVFPCCLRLAEKSLLETDTVKFRTRFPACDINKCRKEVLILDNGVALASGLDPCRITCQKGTAHPGVPERPFPARELRALLTEEEYDGIVKLADFLKSLENGSHFIVKRTELGQIMCHDLTHLRAVDTVPRDFDLVCIKLARVTPCPWGMGIYTANEQKERVIAPAHPFPDPVRTVRCLLGGTAHSKSGNLIELVHRFRTRMVFSGPSHTVSDLRHILVYGPGTRESVLVVLV